MKSKLIFFSFFTIAIISLGFRGCEWRENSYMNWFEYFFYVALGGSGNTSVNSIQQIVSVAVGKNSQIFKSIGGPAAPWIPIQSPTIKDLHFAKALSNTDTSFAYAVGDSGAVIWAADSLTTWLNRSIPNLNRNLRGLDFFQVGINNFQLVVCGDSGTVYKSALSGGNWTWQMINTNTTRNLKSISAITTNIFVVAGDSGLILRTDNGGLTWENKSVGNSSCNRIFEGAELGGAAASRLWIAGNSGKIYKSTNYGSSWLSVNSGTTKNLYDIKFKNLNDGVVAGEDGTIRLTSDGGTNWYSDPWLSLLTSQDIIAVAGVDSNTASALTVSNFSGELKSTDTTFILTVSSEPIVAVSETKNKPPVEFRLHQNYPNPFNPSTRIQYQVSSLPSLREGSTHVSLIVYDILGNEVAVLVNEQKPAGIYEVEFDAKQLTSGIYFYKLQAGSFVETKKMVLIR